MATSEAQKRATVKYRREKAKRLTLDFYTSDIELFDYISTHENKQGYIKNLIRQDMEKNGGK